MSKTKLIVIFIGLAAVAVAVGVLVFRGRVSLRGGGSVVETKGEDKGDKGDDGSTPSTGSGQAGSPQADWATYENPAFGFSFKHPKEFSVSEFDEETGSTGSPQGGHAILFGRFQLFISEFDEPGPITVEMVRRDLPNLVMEEVQEVELPAGSSTSQNVRALIFFSQDESLGRTREAWFIWPEDPKLSGNYLFQVTAKAELDEELSKIMATWRFK